MAGNSVATSGSTHGLWISEDVVLTIGVDRDSKECPPDLAQCKKLGSMIEGLARAANTVVACASESETSVEFEMQPIEDIADAIVLLSQLQQAVMHELMRGNPAR